MSPRTAPQEEWHPVCRLVELEVDRGATALVHGQAIALFRTADDVVYALGNHDPFSRTSSYTLFENGYRQSSGLLRFFAILFSTNF